MTTQTERRIIAVGDLVWDMVVQPDQVLLPGGDTTGRIALVPGGSAANVAAWMARAGSAVGFVGKVGDDTLGERLLDDLQREGVELYASRSTERDTGVILVLIDQQGQRSMVTNQGADFDLRPDDLPEDALSNTSHVHITAWSLFTDPPRQAAIRAAQIAKAAGATVSFDPGSYQMIQEMGDAAFRQITEGLPVDIFFPNRDEGRVLTGEQEPAAIAQALRQRYPSALIVLKLDRDGCYVLADDHAQSYPTEDRPTVDATGGGDAFDAAFLAHYLRHNDLATAAQFANRIAGWVISRFGARPPVDAELEALLRTV